MVKTPVGYVYIFGSCWWWWGLGGKQARRRGGGGVCKKGLFMVTKWAQNHGVILVGLDLDSVGYLYV